MGPADAFALLKNATSDLKAILRESRKQTKLLEELRDRSYEDDGDEEEGEDDEDDEEDEEDAGFFEEFVDDVASRLFRGRGKRP